MVSFKPWPFYLGERAPGTHSIGGVLDRVTKKKSHYSLCRKLNPCRPASSLVSVLTELPRLLENRVLRMFGPKKEEV
jgi:hypothetical protein